MNIKAKEHILFLMEGNGLVNGKTMSVSLVKESSVMIVESSGKANGKKV